MTQVRDILKQSGKITDICCEKIDLKDSFIDTARLFADEPGTVVLMSGGENDCSGDHIAGIRPWLSFKSKNNKISIDIQARHFEIEADPFETLREIINFFKIESEKLTEFEKKQPIIAGLLGYFAYDLKNRLEDLPRTCIDKNNLPDLCVFAPSAVIIENKKSKSAFCFVVQRNHEHKSAAKILEPYFRKSESKSDFCAGNRYFKSCFTKEEYIKAVERIKEYIVCGDVYQVNMSQRFEADFKGNGFAFFRYLYEANPASFFAYINAGDHYITSTSPERFIQRKGSYVETRPIKGTRPRGKTAEQDAELKKELEESKKDDAELSMIVDLMRNDIGKVCAAGSVKVAEHKRLETYENVYHLISIVKGELDKKYDSIDLLKAAFPGGSITGCPKIRSMEIIDELETETRHVYTGSIGYLSFHDTMDISIAIRTAALFNNKITFSVGGGIVFDSDPADEFEETIHKGQTFINALKDKAKTTIPQKKELIWFNGKILPAEDASINIKDYGLTYGLGFFETIRCDNGEPEYLDEHIARFNNAWDKIFQFTAPDLTFKDIISCVLKANDLIKQTAAVKILCCKKGDDSEVSGYNIAVTARPYIHRPEGKKDKGLHLAVYPHPRQTPFADFKSLNYLYYFNAGKLAKNQGYDEAVILNPDNTVSETNSANILLLKDKTVYKPKSLHSLPGIMQNAVLNQFEKDGFDVKTKALKTEDFFSADKVILTNSLMRVVPVLSINGKKLDRTHSWKI